MNSVLIKAVFLATYNFLVILKDLILRSFLYFLLFSSIFFLTHPSLKVSYFEKLSEAAQLLACSERQKSIINHFGSALGSVRGYISVFTQNALASCEVNTCCFSLL